MRKLTLMLTCLAAICVLAGCSRQVKDVVAETSPLVEIDNDFGVYEDVYNKGFQDGVKDQLKELQKEEHTLENPLVVANPYQTNTLGVYVYFTTKEKAQVSYQVTTEGYGDFSRKLYNGETDNLATTHEYLLIGAVPEEANTITITAEDEKGEKLGSYTFTYDAPPLVNTQSSKVAKVTKGESKEPLADGLYTVLGNDNNVQSMETDYVGIYDDEGVVRNEIPIINYRAHEFVFDENGMYYSISSSSIARMDRLGYINWVFGMGDYTLHHDYNFGTQGDLLVLASERGAVTKDDVIVSIDLETKQVRSIVDLRRLLPDYVASSKKPEGAKVLDWMHLNTLSLVGEDDVIVSSREASTIIYISDIYTEPSIKYMIGSPTFWEGTGYEDLLLEQVGEFSLQGGQHSVLYTPDESLPEGQYYLEMFNNNNTYSLARKEYNWAEDEHYYDTGKAMQSRGNPSYYYKYLVDENAGIFELVDSIPVEYSGFVSSVQRVDGNLITDSGESMVTNEFDENNQLIQKIEFTGLKWIYRVKKYTYENFWFVP